MDAFSKPVSFLINLPLQSRAFPIFAADAVVRGHRSGLLTTADYNNLCQCETLDDIKLNLVRAQHIRHQASKSELVNESK